MKSLADTELSLCMLGNVLNPDQDGCFVRPDLAVGPNCLQRLSADNKEVNGR